MFESSRSVGQYRDGQPARPKIRTVTMNSPGPAEGIDRRRETRNACDDIIRWKRPGRIEDQQAWLLDRSDSGLGFLIEPVPTLRVGDVLHLRIRERDGDQWFLRNETVRIMRLRPTPNLELTMVGARVE